MDKIRGTWNTVWEDWKPDFETLVPLGIDYKKEIRSFLVCLILISVSSLIWFLFRFDWFKESLYWYPGPWGKRILMEGAVMPDFKMLPILKKVRIPEKK